MSEQRYDIVMIGGSLMGCATAYHLLRLDSRLRIALVEMDPSYERSSTILSDGNLRVQFNLKENIQISQYGLEALATFGEDMAVDGDRPDVGFRRQGNLFLVSEQSREEAEEGLALQQSLGCEVEWLEPDGIRRRYPILAAPDCVGGTFGANDGTMDPWALLMAFKRKATALGAQFIQGKVTEVLTEKGAVIGVRLESGEVLNAGFVVNAAGAWAPLITQTVGIALPVEPVKRQVFVIETEVYPERTLPAIFSPSGLYIIHEHGNSFMIGKSLPDDPIGYEFTWERQRFIDFLWEELAELFPDFDRLKVVRGWAGLYAVNTFDGNAILGEWPTLRGFYLENGFSGHGFQQCFAVGRYIAELITGRTPSLDLSIFSPSRILENRPAFESHRRLI
ncbi:MAG: FAD-binding oxidoreductase [Caldilineales bacterium]|nr:FAD-binding oxidoreductase [Caldilineales bacterium]